MDYDALEKRLREPPFGTETSERNLVAAAAAIIADLRARNDALIETCAKVVDNHRPDASFDDSASGAMERNALLDNVAAEIRSLAARNLKIVEDDNAQEG